MFLCAGGGTMSNETSRPIATTVYTTIDGRAVIEQAQGSIVLLSAQQILEVIQGLHACYDYCATWKEPGERPS
jgi:hypothetical protein